MVDALRHRTGEQRCVIGYPPTEQETIRPFQSFGQEVRRDHTRTVAVPLPAEIARRSDRRCCFRLYGAASWELQSERQTSPMDGHEPPPGHGQDCCFVAHAGLIAAVPLSLSARLKRESDRGRHEARRASVFVNPALIAAMSAKASFIAGRLLPAANTAPATEELASTS